MEIKVWNIVLSKIYTIIFLFTNDLFWSHRLGPPLYVGCQMSIAGSFLPDVSNKPPVKLWLQLVICRVVWPLLRVDRRFTHMRHKSKHRTNNNDNNILLPSFPRWCRHSLRQELLTRGNAPFVKDFIYWKLNDPLMSQQNKDWLPF